MAKNIFSYNDAINPITFTICALELKPFSLGSYILLEQIDSPFLTDNPGAEVEMISGLSQFLMCLLICSQTYEDNKVMLEDRILLDKTVKIFTASFLKSMALEPHWNIYTKLALFKEYIKYFTDMPIFQKEQKTESVPSGIDWKQNLFTIAKSEFGYKETEILNMPLKRLFYEWCSYAEKNGAIRVQNAEEMDNLAELMKLAELNKTLCHSTP